MRSIAFTDVQYRDPGAVAACVLAPSWDASTPSSEWTCVVQAVAPYEPGAFYRRELPCLLDVLGRAPALEAVVIDGYVWLDGLGTRGLGAHLSEALQVPVIGLAKTAYRGSTFARAVPRPGSVKPLFLTCIGLDVEEAAAQVAKLHGPHRLPTLLKRVDALARGRVTALTGTPNEPR
jgi:deoxyribonuclease V